MTNNHTPKGATGDARPRSTNTKAPATGIAEAPGANGPSTREHSTHVTEKTPRGASRWTDRRTNPDETAPTWRQAYPGMRALLRDMRAGAVTLSSPKLALAYLICRDVSRSEMGCRTEGGTMARGAALALEGIGQALGREGILWQEPAAGAGDARLAAELAARIADLFAATGGAP
ncbi:MAG: hypothetical protein JWM10_2561 [Myxococcaceae bacterium]|nr:hypothetical protein [Myxococcaceae bacterium]